MDVLVHADDLDQAVKSASPADLVAALAAAHPQEPCARTIEEELMRRLRQRSRPIEDQIPFHDVLHHVPTGILLADAPSGKVLFFNADAVRLLGQPPALTSVQEYDRLNGTRADGTPYAAEEYPLARALRGEVVQDEQMRFTAAGGSYVHVSVNAAPIRDSSGVVVAAVASHHDITPLKQLQLRLEQNEGRLHENELIHRHLVEAVQDYALYMIDLEGRMLSWNAGAERLTGWKAEEVVGKHVSILFPPELIAQGLPEHQMARAAAHGSHTEEDTVRVRKDGTRFPAAVSLHSLRDEDGRVWGFVKVARDLTERKRTEEALRRSEKQYRDLVENSPEPMAVHSNGRLLFINKAGARLIGARTDELIGRNVLDFVHPDSVPLVLERLQRMRAGTEILPPVDEVFLRLDGTSVEVETVAIPITYDGGPAVQLIFRDVSHRRAQSRRLEELVAARTADLQRAIKDLETFSNSASHDLRAPLRGVDALLSDAVEAQERGDAEEAAALLKLAHKENRKAQRLVQDLLSFAKTGRNELHVARVNVTRLAQGIADDLDGAYPDRQTRWSIESGMQVEADEGLLRIALYNLLDNASKYASRASIPRVQVRQTTTPEGDVLVIQDNGVGFPQKEAYRLFQTFARLSTAQGFEGTGLGLAAVERVASRHGGRAWAESTPGQGATFFLLLPRGGE